MTTFTEDWNAAFEAHPADTDDVGGGGDDIRDLKVATREVLNVDHYVDPNGTVADHGEHRKLTLHEPITTPTNVADKGFLYGKDASGKIELHFLDEDGNEVQLTTAGSPSSSAAFASGTKMLFYQNTAPTGWTIDNTLDDKLVFVTKGSLAGGQTGGGAHSAGTWTISGLSASGGSAVVASAECNADDSSNQRTVGAAGAATFTDPSISQSGAWRPAAYCCIIASKD